MDGDSAYVARALANARDAGLRALSTEIGSYIRDTTAVGGMFEGLYTWSKTDQATTAPGVLETRICHARVCPNCHGALACVRADPVMAPLPVHKYLLACAVMTLSMGLVGARVMYDEATRPAGAEMLHHCAVLCTALGST
jgi:hypothetical protein